MGDIIDDSQVNCLIEQYGFMLSPPLVMDIDGFNSNGEEIYGTLNGISTCEWWDAGSPYFLGFGARVYLTDTVTYTMDKMHWYVERQVDDYPLDTYDRTFDKYVIDIDVTTQVSAVVQQERLGAL